MTQNKNKKLQ